jgi:hypothetical protein
LEKHNFPQPYDEDGIDHFDGQEAAKNDKVGRDDPDLGAIDVFGQVRQLIAVENRQDQDPEGESPLDHVVHVVIVQELAHRIPDAPRGQENKDEDSLLDQSQRQQTDHTASLSTPVLSLTMASPASGFSGLNANDE